MNEIYDLMTNYQPLEEFLQFLQGTKKTQDLFEYILEYVRDMREQMFPENEMGEEAIVNSMYEYVIKNPFCLNCFNEIEYSNSMITTCSTCGWRNETDMDPVLNPIILKQMIFRDHSVQIAYPVIEKSLLQYLPPKLRNAVECYFKTPEKLTKQDYQNIYHHLYDADIRKLGSRKKRLEAKIEFASFFKKTNFLKS